MDEELHDEVVKDFNSWREEIGLRPIKTRKVSKKRLRSFSISDEAYEGLKFIASQNKIRSMHGSMLSVSAMLESIGLYDLLVVDPNKKE